MILVTGASGFVGQHVLRELAAQGHKQVRCTVRPGTAPSPFASIVNELPSLDIELFPVSFNDTAALQDAFEDVEVVYHLAATKQGAPSVQVANTVVGSDHIYRAAVTAHVSRFVLVSSFSVLGVAKLPRGALVDEQVPLDDHPEWRGSYAFAKHYQEMLAWEYARNEGLPLVVVRPGVIYGPNSDMLDRRMGKRISNCFFHFGGRNQIPLAHVDNASEAIVLAGSVPDIDGEVFHLVDDDLPTSRYLLRRYCQTVTSLYVIPLPYKLLRLLSQCNVWYTNRTKGQLPVVYTPHTVDAEWKGHRYSNDRAKARLGWMPKVSMTDGLDETFSRLAKKGTGSV